MNGLKPGKAMPWVTGVEIRRCCSFLLMESAVWGRLSYATLSEYRPQPIFSMPDKDEIRY